MRIFEPFASALAAFYAIVPSYGLAIILLTIVVRLLLLPLSIKQTRSMREMQKIQPEVKKLQAKYKGNRQKLNEEMMALYKEHGVNPFGGCLPLLMQFPVFIALYRVISTPLAYMSWTPDSALARGLDTMAVKVNHFGLFRLDCTPRNVLSAADPEAGRLAVSCYDGVAGSVPYLVLIALMGLTMWYQQKQMSGNRTPTDAQAQQMAMMGKIMPVMFMFFSFTFPAGLTLYWLTSNVWTIGQQHLMLRSANESFDPAGNGAGGKPKAATKPEPKPAKGEGNGKATTRSKSASQKKKKR